MKTTVLAIMLLCATAAGLRAGEIAWQSDYETALADASKAGQPVLLYFTATWCGPCRMMAATTFADAEVQKAFEPLAAVKIDHDKHPELIGKYRVHGVPTLILMNRFGEQVATQVGYMEAKQLLSWLETNRAAAEVTVSKAEAAREKAVAIIGPLESEDPAERQQGIAKAIQSYLAKDDFSPTAAKVLEKLVERTPDEIVPHLNDDHLAVRILLANLLAKKVGPTFAFDPWAAKEEREAALKGLEKK